MDLNLYPFGYETLTLTNVLSKAGIKVGAFVRPNSSLNTHLQLKVPPLVKASNQIEGAAETKKKAHACSAPIPRLVKVQCDFIEPK